VVGREGSLVFAHGQNPSLSAQTTDLTNGWLGWSLRFFSKASTLIGEVILKRSEFWAIVLRAALFWSSFLGTDGSGEAASVEYADTTLGLSDDRQIKVGEY